MSAEEKPREEHHRYALQDPGSWHMVGSDLLVAAELLVRRATCLDEASQTYDMRVLGPGLMLRGLGVENLLKGLFVLRGGKLGTGKNAGDMPCKQHDLLKMAEIAAAVVGSLPRDESLRPTQQEKPMLESLHGCLLFAGRYPIPRSSDDIVLHSKAGRDERVMWSLGYEREFETFVQRLALPFYEGKTVEYAGKAAAPDRFTWRDLLRQSVEAWACRQWIDTGGYVGNQLLTPWAVVQLTLEDPSSRDGT